MVASTIRWGLIQLKMILWYDCPWSLAPIHFHLHCHLRLLTFTLWCHHVLPQQPGLEHPALHPELQHPGLHRPWLHSPRLQGLVQMWEVLWLKWGQWEHVQSWWRFRIFIDHFHIITYLILEFIWGSGAASSSRDHHLPPRPTSSEESSPADKEKNQTGQKQPKKPRKETKQSKKKTKKQFEEEEEDDEDVDADHQHVLDEEDDDDGDLDGLGDLLGDGKVLKRPACKRPASAKGRSRKSEEASIGKPGWDPGIVFFCVYSLYHYICHYLCNNL